MKAKIPFIFLIHKDKKRWIVLEHAHYIPANYNVYTAKYNVYTGSDVMFSREKDGAVDASYFLSIVRDKKFFAFERTSWSHFEHQTLEDLMAAHWEYFL